MSKLQRVYRVASFLLVTLCLSEATAQDAALTRPIPMVLPAPEEMGNGPSHFFLVRSDLMGIVDPIEGQIIFLDNSGAIVGRAPLPSNFRVGSIAPAPGGVMLRTSDGRQLLIPSNVDPKQPSFTTVRAVPKSSLADNYVMRIDPKTMQLRPAQANQQVIEVKSITGGQLAEIENLGVDQRGNRYALWSEITAVQPVLNVESFAGRFNAAGVLTGIARVPLADMEIVPNRPALVTPNGALRVLVPGKAGVAIREYSFQPIAGGGRAGNTTANGPAILKSLDGGPSATVISLPSKIVDPGVTKQNFRWPPEDKTARAAKPLKEISRQDILKNAKAYIGVQWILSATNFENSQIANECAKENGRYWQRPSFLTSDSVGKKITRIPYNWGGFDTPEAFAKKMNDGKLAGNVCTCREPEYNYCQVPEAAGVDCSGFVSRAWGLPEKQGTSQLAETTVSKAITSILDVRPGDAFDRPGSHVRLVFGTVEGANLTFVILESTTAPACEGVCEQNYTAKQLSGYKPIRYKLVVD